MLDKGIVQIFQGILDMIEVDTETQRPKASSWSSVTVEGI